MNSTQPTRLRPFRPVPFGRYTLLLPLSTGGMGEVYIARVQGTEGFERLCVVKRALPHLAAESDFAQRFVDEARTLVKLQHGCIAQVLDLGEHEGAPYLVLEYVDGKDLRKIMAGMRDRGLPIPLTVVLYVMGRVLEALSYVHRKRDEEGRELGLIHRDVSPQNILVAYEGEVKLIDFGLAKSRVSGANTNPSIIMGKFMYMAPEQARHQPVDPRADLYAAGLCLYELIAGANPFERVHPADLMDAVASPAIPSLHEVEPLCPSSVEALVSKALAVDPDQRFQTADEFRARLLSCLVEIDPLAGPETVSRFMRQAFATEYQQERRLLRSLSEQARHLPPPDEETAVRSSLAGVLEPLPVLKRELPFPAEAPYADELSGPQADTSPGDDTQPGDTDAAPGGPQVAVNTPVADVPAVRSPAEAATPIEVPPVVVPEVVPPSRRVYALSAAIAVLLAAGLMALRLGYLGPSESPEGERAPPPIAGASPTGDRQVNPNHRALQQEAQTDAELEALAVDPVEALTPDPARPATKGPALSRPAASRALQTAQREYQQVQSVYRRLEQAVGCDSLGALCTRYEELARLFHRVERDPGLSRTFIKEARELRTGLERLSRDPPP